MSLSVLKEKKNLRSIILKPVPDHPSFLCKAEITASVWDIQNLSSHPWSRRCEILCLIFLENI